MQLFDDELWTDYFQYTYTANNTEKEWSVGGIRVDPSQIESFSKLNNNQFNKLQGKNEGPNPCAYGTEGLVFYCQEGIFEHFGVGVDFELMAMEGLIDNSIYESFSKLKTDEIKPNILYFPEKEVSIIHRVMKVNGINNPHFLLYDHRTDKVTREIDENIDIRPVADEILKEQLPSEKLLAEVI